MSLRGLFKIEAVAAVCFGVSWLLQAGASGFFRKTSILPENHAKTLETFVKSIIMYGAVAVVGVCALDILGVNISKLFMGAGVLAAALGFAAQSVIKDFLFGIFRLAEKEMRAGDAVTINGAHTGTVEEMSIRKIKIREYNGLLLTINHSDIKTIQNANAGKMRVIEKVTASFYQNPKDVIAALERACAEMNEASGAFLLTKEGGEAEEAFRVAGLSSLNSNNHGYEYSVAGLVKDEHFAEAGQIMRLTIAQHLFDSKIKMAEENKHYRTKLNS